jgi:hypothetical protein
MSELEDLRAGMVEQIERSNLAVDSARMLQAQAEEAEERALDQLERARRVTEEVKISRDKWVSRALAAESDLQALYEKRSPHDVD